MKHFILPSLLNVNASIFAGTGGPCSDVLSNCQEYTQTACHEPYVDWARKNCAKFCGYCGMYYMKKQKIIMSMEWLNQALDCFCFLNPEICSKTIPRLDD